MGQTIIRVADKVEYCHWYEDGEVIYKAMREELGKGNHVTLSFDSIVGVPSGFINGCFNDLFREFPVDWVKKNIKVVQSTNLINDMIRRRVRIQERLECEEEVGTFDTTYG